LISDAELISGLITRGPGYAPKAQEVYARMRDVGVVLLDYLKEPLFWHGIARVCVCRPAEHQAMNEQQPEGPSCVQYSHCVSLFV
jgi:hypothetical protein